MAGKDATGDGSMRPSTSRLPAERCGDRERDHVCSVYSGSNITGNEGASVMRVVAFLTLLLAGFSPAASKASDAADAKSLQDIRLVYEMDVDATGHATSLKSVTEIPSDIDAKIRTRVREFAFMPATRDGQPVPAHTTLYLTLGPIALPDGGKGYGITGASTGPRLVSGRGKRPMGWNERGGAYFTIGFNAEGYVTSLKVEESAPKTGARPYYKWAEAFIRTLRFQPETVAGHPVPGRVRMPLVSCYRSCPDLAPAPQRHDGFDNQLTSDMIAESVLALKAPLKPTVI